MPSVMNGVAWRRQLFSSIGPFFFRQFHFETVQGLCPCSGRLEVVFKIWVVCLESLDVVVFLFLSSRGAFRTFHRFRRLILLIVFQKAVRNQIKYLCREVKSTGPQSAFWSHMSWKSANHAVETMVRFATQQAGLQFCTAPIHEVSQVATVCLEWRSARPSVHDPHGFSDVKTFSKIKWNAHS